MQRISGRELATILKKVARGELPVVLHPEEKRDWVQCYAGNVTFLIDGWTFVFFNDCDCLDYLDHAVSPGGARVEFEELETLREEPISYLMTHEENRRLEVLLKSARQQPLGK